MSKELSRLEEGGYGEMGVGAIGESGFSKKSTRPREGVKGDVKRILKNEKKR